MSRSLESSVGRDSPSSSNHYAFTNPMQLDPTPQLGATGQSVPPFDPTKPFLSLTDRGNNKTSVDIQAKIDKGFFRADQDWTCYRRNYFSVACSFSLRSETDVEPDQTYLHRPGAPPELIQSFAICIAARVDGEDGKSIELVQHTPKRDKGPMSAPEKREVRANPSGNLGIFSGQGYGASQSMNSDYDSMYPGGISENPNVANFERIQFKKATANNGKRRAAQQYFHIVVELFVKVAKGKSGETEWVKIAHRVSAQMVVRGRSPGHYQDDRRGSTNLGPGAGSSGDFGTSHRDLTSASGLSGGRSAMSGSGYTNRMNHTGYQNHHVGLVYPSEAKSVPSSVGSSMGSSCGRFVDDLSESETPMEDAPQMTNGSNNYNYYQGSLFDISVAPSSPRTANGVRSSAKDVHHTLLMALPGVKEESVVRAPRIKNGTPKRSGSAPSYHSPIFGNAWHAGSSGQLPRDCRPPLHLESSNNYYPAMSAQ